MIHFYLNYKFKYCDDDYDDDFDELEFQMASPLLMNVFLHHRNDSSAYRRRKAGPVIQMKG